MSGVSGCPLGPTGERVVDNVHYVCATAVSQRAASERAAGKEADRGGGLFICVNCCPGDHRHPRRSLPCGPGIAGGGTSALDQLGRHRPRCLLSGSSPQLLDLALRTTQQPVNVEAIGVGRYLRRDPSGQPHEGGSQRLSEPQDALETRKSRSQSVALPQAVWRWVHC
jgi:hypothetical protein